MSTDSTAVASVAVHSIVYGIIATKLSPPFGCPTVTAGATASAGHIHRSARAMTVSRFATVLMPSKPKPQWKTRWPVWKRNAAMRPFEYVIDDTAPGRKKRDATLVWLLAPVPPESNRDKPLPIGSPPTPFTAGGVVPSFGWLTVACRKFSKKARSDGLACAPDHKSSAMLVPLMKRLPPACKYAWISAWLPGPSVVVLSVVQNQI